MRPLVWLRADLRTRDNPALAHARRDADDGVAAAFLICPEQWRAHGWGPPRADFVRRTLDALAGTLAERNIPLRIIHAPTFDDAPDALAHLNTELGCDALYFNDELEVNERRRDDAVEAAFRRRRLPVRRFRDQTALPVEQIRTTTGGFYTVFTPFRKRWIALLEEDPGQLAPEPRPAALERAVYGADPVPGRFDGFDLDAGLAETLAETWPAGEEEAERRLERFRRSAIDDYADDRNRPSLDGTSRLSPYLAVGAISARRCLHLALGDDPAAAAGGSGLATWVSELIWREFYRHVLVGFPRVCMGQPFRLETRQIRWRDDAEGFRAWAEGRTGIPMVDAGMRQLAAIGWMHNRVRMITAMFLTKNLLIDWRRGERHFMQHLVDGDFASNNGGWQWSASTGTDAAPYFRIFNPVTQGKRFDPDGAYIRRWVPELASVEAVHDPPAAARSACGYPEPIVDLGTSRTRAIEAFKTVKASPGLKPTPPSR